jgi:hypothetical protein
MLLTPTDAVVVRQSKRDARLKKTKGFLLFIEVADGMIRSKGGKVEFCEVSQMSFFPELGTRFFVLGSIMSSYINLTSGQ